MTKTPKHLEELREKILKGMELAYERMIAEKKRNGGSIVYMENGEMVIKEFKSAQCPDCGKQIEG